MIESHKDYQDMRGELRAMGVSLNVIEYVECSMRIAYELGGRDAMKDCAQQAASGAKVKESFLDYSRTHPYRSVYQLFITNGPEDVRMEDC